MHIYGPAHYVKAFPFSSRGTRVTLAVTGALFGERRRHLVDGCPRDEVDDVGAQYAAAERVQGVGLHHAHPIVPTNRSPGRSVLVAHKATRGKDGD